MCSCPDSVARKCFSSFFKLLKGRRKREERQYIQLTETPVISVCIHSNASHRLIAVIRVHHGFANPRGWAGTGRVEVTRPKPIPVPRVWRVWFRRDNEGFTLLATSNREWSRGSWC